MMDNIALQNDEIFALRSIYCEKELIIEDEKPSKGRFNAEVQLRSPFYVRCGEKGNVCKYTTYEIKYFPPINLFFEFPDTYPSNTCPAFLLSCSWLNLDQLSDLCRKLELLWVENSGEVVLFRWIDFLANEVLEFLDIIDTHDITKLSTYKLSRQSRIDSNLANAKNELKSIGVLGDNPLESCNKNCESKETDKCSNETELRIEDDALGEDILHALFFKPSVHGGSGRYDCRAVLDLKNGAMLVTLLQKYDKNKKKELFLNDWVTCDICFSTKKGSDFLKFNKCNHLFCKECLKSFFEVQIKEGNVHSLNCPAEQCDSQAESAEVKQLVTIELFQKYDTLLLSRTLDSMEDVVYCPRKECQTPLLSDPDNNMGCCPTCSFVFCLYCRMAYHGVQPCNLRLAERKELITGYLEGDAQERMRLEKRYGKREMQLFVSDMLSEEWISTNGKKCPHCQTIIEKNEGCNKMTCFKCGTFFCWLCNQRLSVTNPYSHYSNTLVPCYNQLFPEDDDYFEPGEFLH